MSNLSRSAGRTLRLPTILAGFASLAICLIAVGAPEPSPQGDGSPDHRYVTMEPLPADFDPAQRGLEVEPLSVDTFGLEMYLPRGARVTNEPIGSRLTILVREGIDPPTWSMRIEPRPGLTFTATPQAQITEQIRRLEAAKREYRIVEQGPVQYRGLKGFRCFVEMPRPDGEAFVTGWTAMPAGAADRFLMFSVRTLPDNLSAVKASLENSFRTIAIRSPEDVSAGRRERLQAGANFLAALSEERLRELIGFSKWYRLYQPGDGPGPAREVGYSRVEIREGKRGELNPERKAGNYDALEQQSGLLVAVQGRVILDASTRSYYDSIGLYWTAWDCAAEAWSVRGTQRQGDIAESQSETGVLPPTSAGDPRSRLTVIRSNARSFSRDPFEWVVPEVYLPHGLSWVIGLLMPRDDATEPREFAYYTYQSGSATPSLSLRVDTWGPAEDNRSDWLLSTRHGTGDAVVAGFDREGLLIFRGRADGMLTEPIRLDQLRRLWASKGLQVGRIKD